MRKTKEQKAITLIALIITIVVLLILAVVAINAVTGDGIIQHASNAKTEYEKAQTEEEMMLSNYETYLKGNLDTWDGESKKTPTIKDGDWYIYTCSELKFLADFVNEIPGMDKTGIEEITQETTVYLMSNLDFGARQTDEVWNGTKWTPIGSSSTISFEGIFEGNNHYIKGLYVNQTDNFAGLFGYSTNTIKNLSVKDSYIESSGACIGGLVGRGDTIINCHNINTTVKQTANYTIGGIAGQAKFVENCSNSGDIMGNSYIDDDDNSTTGGIIGALAQTGEINRCKNSGTIYSIGARVGGIVGNANDSSDINLCFNNGKITGMGNVGGIVGCISHINDYNESTVMNCYNTGEIEGTDRKNVGGIIGFFAGTIAQGKVKACYNIGTIGGPSKLGGIIGENESTLNTIEKCYYLKGTSSTAIGDANDIDNEIDSMSEAEMTTNVLRDKLNEIDGSWIGINGEYPKLKWEG